jgi:hypothetical protein
MQDAYIAGLFDGEGSVGIYRVSNGMQTASGKKVYWAVRLSIVGAHRPMIEAVWRATGIGLFTTQKRQNIQRTPRMDYAVRPQRTPEVRLCKQGWKWQITDRGGIRSILERIRPHLFEKACQSDIVLSYLRDEISGKEASLRCKEAKRFTFPVGDFPEYAPRRLGSHCGLRNPAATITPRMANAIKEALASGLTQKVVAKRFDIGQSSVSRIFRKAHWTKTV